MRHGLRCSPVLFLVGCLPSGLFPLAPGGDGQPLDPDQEVSVDGRGEDTGLAYGALAPSECGASVDAPAWTTALRWSWDGVAADPAYRHVHVAPVTGDLDGDGLPEVVAVALAEEGHQGGLADGTTGWLVVLDGATGLEILAVPDVYGMVTRLVAHDLDGDGDDEVLAIVGGELAALDLGGVIWTVAACDEFIQHAAADLDGDGDVEVVNGGCGVVDGATGQVVAPGWPHDDDALPELVDTDGDGLLDIALDADVRDADGALVGALPPGSSRTMAVLGGAAPRAVTVDIGFEFTVVDSALQPIGSFTRTDLDRPLVCSGDVDRDGEAELLVPAASELALLELDGSLVWSAGSPRIGGDSGAQACTVADLDQDGCLEVVWPQNGRPRVYDAATGRLRAVVGDDETPTATGQAQPIVDLDGDGTLELVVGGGSRDPERDATWTGIRAYGEATGAWTGAAP